MKLAKILAIIFFVSGLVVVLLLGGYFNYMYYGILTEKIYSHLQTAVESKADHVEMFLHEHKQAVLTLSDDIVFRELLTADKSKSGYKEKFERANKQLESIVAINDEFNEVFILDSDGKIAATSHTLEEIGADFSGDAYFLKGKDGLYLKDAYYDEDLKEKSMGTSAPVLDEKTGEVIGVIVAEISLKELIDIMTDRIGLGETGEVYVINKDKLLITPSRFIDNSIMAQKVDTENSQKCLSDIEEYISKGEFFSHTQHNYENDPMKFLDYRGENVLGTHDLIPEMNWCVLAEMDESEAITSPINKIIKNQIIISVVVIFILTLIGFFVGNYFDKKNKKINKYPCGVKGKSQPWYCRLYGAKCHTYPNGRCGRVIKTRNFLINLKLSHSILIALIFIIGYFFLVTSFFQGWRNAALYDEISDLSAVFVLILLFFYGLKLKKNSAGFFISFGSLLAIFDKLVQIILEEYISTYGIISAFYWIPGAIIGFIGLILIFFGFREELK